MQKKFHIWIIKSSSSVLLSKDDITETKNLVSTDTHNAIIYWHQYSFFISDIDRAEMKGDPHWNKIHFILKQLLNKVKSFPDKAQTVVMPRKTQWTNTGYCLRCYTYMYQKWELTQSLLNHSCKDLSANWEFCCSGSELKRNNKDEWIGLQQRETKQA